jgi:signal transduction histidine kinase
VHVQAVLLAELVGILLDNAEKYRDPQTSISVTLSATGGTARLTIENAGPHLTSKELAELFTPFCRGERARLNGVGGAGLGLSIARRLTETFGGMITAEAAPGDRIRFIVELPLAPDAEPASSVRVPQGAES